MHLPMVGQVRRQSRPVQTRLGGSTRSGEMTLRFEDLSAAIERNDGLAVARYLKSATEAERRAVSSKVRALCNKIWTFHGDRSATVVAILGTAGGIRQVSQVIGPLGVEQWTEEAIAVLRERNPPWLSDIPRALLTGNEFQNTWRFVRELVRAGLVPRPDIPEYITLMPQGIASRARNFRGRDEVMSIEEQLIADPGLLRDEIFQLFHVEGAARNLYWADAWVDQPRQWQEGKWVGVQRRPEATWRATLARLARRGSIDFDRLLDECIGSFVRDLRPTQLGWYVGMHDELAPTLDEMAARAAAYERLLAADASIGIGLGQKVLQTLVDADRLDYESLVRASAPALARSEKSIVVKQLKLLERVVKERPDLASSVREVLEPVLTHERPELQEAARKLVDRLPGPRPPTAPQGVAEPSHGAMQDESAILARARRLSNNSAWSAQIRASLEALERGSPLPAWTIPVGAGTALPPPITEPEEVVEAFTRLVENAGDPILIERAIAGAVRTARVPVAKRGRLAAPLAKRSREQLPGWPSGLTGADPRAMVASVAYAWSTGTPVTPSFDRQYHEFALRHSSLDEHFQPVTPTGVLAVRCMEAIDLIAKGATTELLAEPTHERGAIDPNAFLDRARKSYGGWLSSGPPRFDLETAALRIRPGAMDGMLGELPRATRGQMTALLRDIASWVEIEIVSGRAKDRYENTGRLVVLAKVAEIGSRSTILKCLTNLADPIGSYSRLSAEGEFSTGYGWAIKTWPMIVPWLPELAAAHLLRPLSRALHPGKHDQGPSAVSCLLHRDVPLGPVGHLALAMGCMGAEGDTRTAAGDVFAAAVKDGRLQPAAFAEALLELARGGAFQAKRLESTLRSMSSSLAGGLRLAQTLELALGPLVASGVRDMHVLIRLAASAGQACGLFPDLVGLDAGAGAKPNTEFAKAIAALAAARSSNAQTTRAASLDLLDHLLDRAES